MPLLQIPHTNSLRLGVGDFIACAFADIAADVDYEDLIGHVNLAFVHVVEHSLGTFGPDFIVSAVTEQANGYDNVAFKGQTLLCFQVLLLELRAAERVITLYLPTMD